MSSAKGSYVPLWKRLLGIGKPPRQTCWVYCPGCRVDLCTEPDTTSTDTDLVRYVCGRCGWRSTWDFDIAPVPILISEPGWSNAPRSGH